MNTDELVHAIYVAEQRVLGIQAKLHRWARESRNSHPGPLADHGMRNHPSMRDLRSARCLETGTPGAGSGPGKRAGR